MSIVFAAPVPGQSLTSSPKNLPFERPPEITDPVEALRLHIRKISNKDSVKDMMYFIENGITIVSLVEGMLRSAVMSGIHSIDTSVIIAPAIHEYIVGILDEAGIEYDEGFDDDKKNSAMDYERKRSLALQLIEEAEGEEIPSEIEAEKVEEEVTEDVEPQMGLMSRR